jgi:hypothetical protein
MQLSLMMHQVLTSDRLYCGTNEGQRIKLALENTHFDLSRAFVQHNFLVSNCRLDRPEGESSNRRKDF